MRKILLADDDKDMLTLLKGMLIKHGFIVLDLYKGELVLPNIHIFQPDLVILDINLGDADGREICQAIKSQKKFSAIPVVLFSAESWPDDTIADCQATAFIRKPFSSSFFLEKIEALMAA